MARGKPKGSGTVRPSKPVLLLLSRVLYGDVSESECTKLRRQIDLCAKLLCTTSGPIASFYLFRLSARSMGTMWQEKEVRCLGAQQGKSMPLAASGLIPKT